MGVKKVVVVIGTRPEAIKLLPVYFKLCEQADIMPILLSTGQHKDMLNQIFRAYEISPDYDLDVMGSATNLSSLTGHLFLALDEFFEQHLPDALIVQGDTTTAMVGGMVGFYRKIFVAHVEAGLRTFNKYAPFPEEINRQVLSKLADIHFAPTVTAEENLRREQISNVYTVGNTVIDSLQHILKRVSQNENYYLKRFSNIDIREKNIILLTVHRRENHGEALKDICSAIRELAKRYPELNWILPVHLNPQVKEVVSVLLSGLRNVFLLPPLQYDELVFFLSKAKLVLTDSGGVQEEAPSFNVPVLVLRETTERPEGIKAGCAQLVGTKRDQIIESFERLYNDAEVYKMMVNIPNPYGDGRSSDRIVKYLLKHVS